MGGCIITDGTDDTEGNTNPTGTQTSGETDPGTTSTPTPATESGGTTEDPPATDSTGTDPTEGNDTTEGEGTTGDPPSKICANYADQITECYNEKEGMAALDYCGEYLQQLYDDYGKACVTTYEDYLACLSVLTCEELMAAEPCAEELATVTKTCVGK